MIRHLYSLVGYVAAPFLRHWLNRRVARGKEDAARLGERFGYPSQPRPEGPVLWLHAASVGETQSVLTLIRALIAHDATLHFLITTGTVTSAALVAQQQLPRTIHQFTPVDTPPSVQRFLAHWRPTLALWVESEFWPQLLWRIRAHAIPLLLINARISARSAKGWQRWPGLIRDLLGCFTAIYAGSSDDAKRLRELGALHVFDVGNLKYDAAPLPVDEELLAGLREQCGTRPVWVAASTHPNEEQTIAEVHASLRETYPDALCLLIPRHAARGDAIAEDLRGRWHSVAQRSKYERITASTAIYLADTMGELGSFYHFASLVFLGGSLVAVGGHNPLEPARLSCALLSGPHVHNFAAIMEDLRAHQALEIVADKEVLLAALQRLLADSVGCQAMAERARIRAENTKGAGEVILQHVAQLLAGQQP